MDSKNCKTVADKIDFLSMSDLTVTCYQLAFINNYEF